MIVYRGTSTSTFDAPLDQLEHTVVRDRGYTSTSLTPSGRATRAARAWLDPGPTPRYPGNGVFITLRVPRGTPAAGIGAWTWNQETELLLPRQVPYYFHKVEKRDGIWYVEAEVLPPGSYELPRW